TGTFCGRRPASGASITPSCQLAHILSSGSSTNGVAMLYSSTVRSADNTTPGSSRPGVVVDGGGLSTTADRGVLMHTLMIQNRGIRCSICGFGARGSAPYPLASEAEGARGEWAGSRPIGV